MSKAAAALVAIVIALAATGPGHADTPRGIEQRFAASLTEVPHGDLPVVGSFCVPAYSSVSLSHDRLRADFSVTLSVHNASEDQVLVLDRIAYFDTGGALIETYLDRRIALKPFATIQVYVAINDLRRGIGANFAVDWAAAAQIPAPVVETLMLGGVGNADYSFISPGRPIRTVGR
jgi:hypothetical protein